MIKVQILDFNREPEIVFDETFQNIKSVNCSYDCGRYTLQVNNECVFNGFVSNDYELNIEIIQKQLLMNMF